jgi:hypothetical protein
MKKSLICVVLLSLTGFCYSQNNSSLSEEEEAYIEKTYGGVGDFAKFYATLLIPKAKKLIPLCESYITDFGNNTLLTNMTNLKIFFEKTYNSPIVEMCNYSNTMRLPVSFAMTSIKNEFERTGVTNNIEKCMDLIRQEIIQLDRVKKPDTINLYAILSQYQEAIISPTGSLSNYAQTINTYNSDFSKSLTLAKIK